GRTDGRASRSCRPAADGAAAAGSGLVQHRQECRGSSCWLAHVWTVGQAQAPAGVVQVQPHGGACFFRAAGGNGIEDGLVLEMSDLRPALLAGAMATG